MALTINGTLNMLGNATFTSSSSQGFTTLNYTQAIAGSVVTLKAGTTYTVTGQLTITGTVASRCTLQSNTKFPGTFGVVSTNQLTATGITLNPVLASRPAGSEYLMSQSPTNTALLKRGVTAMNGSDVTDLNSFPRVTAATSGGSVSPFTLSKSFTMSSRNVQIGLTTKFIHSSPLGSAARSLNYVTTFDIDSRTSNGILLADNSYQNRVGVPSPNLWRTINWGELTPLLPLVTVGYIE
jgi:hypothetical protein